MHIGVDFDNTVVCYDALFHKVARELNLIPVGVPVNKSDVRNHLRRAGNEAAWTEMQGYVYGARMSEAAPYPGVLEFFRACRDAGVRVSIISHKTKHPFLGEPHNLHAAAAHWLEQQGFFADAKIGLPRDRVFFELTKQAKLARIGECGCTHFIDDLPEFLAEAAFPASALRILFDSNNLYAEEKGFVRVLDWGEARSLFANELTSPAEADRLREKVSPFVQTHGVNGPFVLQPLPGGANNRVYRLRAESGDRVLKLYFQNPVDPRDRFGAEQAFYDVLWRHRVRRTPEPLGWDPQNHLGLFSHVPGRKLRAEEVNEAAVGEARQFIIEANRARARVPPGSIPIASEACFSIGEHLALVQARVARLQTLEPRAAIDAQAAAFVREELNPAWETIREAISTGAGKHLADVLPQSGRCLSPSDFGFHNALMAEDGRLRFFDFEYAGWDDPAKLCCDFFCQPQVPVPASHRDNFLNGLARGLNLDAAFAERVRLLQPAYQVKWCCIMLNEFVRGDRARRDFAKGAADADERRQTQLEKARQSLRRI